MNKKVKFLKENGIYYTDSNLAQKMIKSLNINYKENFSIAELAVGEGHILKYIVADYLKSNKDKEQSQIVDFLENNIFAFDNRKEAIEICKSELDKVVKKYLGESIVIKWNIKTIDILNISKLKNNFNKFDYIISNPPFIARRNLDKRTVANLERYSKFCNKFNYNFYYYFMEIGFKLWNKCKKMVFITPNSYIKSNSAKKMNEFFLTNHYFEKIIDFQNRLMFENADTFTAISIFSPGNKFLTIVDSDNKIISKQNYNLIDKTNLNPFYNYKNTSKTKTINDIAKVRTGIATLQDHAFVVKEKEVKKIYQDYFLIQKNNSTYKIEKNIIKKGVRASNLDQKNYLIFPYTYVNKKLVLIKDLKNRFPLTFNYLTSVLPEKYQEKYGYGWGRTQGMSDYNASKIIVSRNARLHDNPFYMVNEGFIISGIYIVPNNVAEINELKKYLNSESVQKLIDTLSKTYVKGYKSLSSTLLKNIPLNQSFFKSLGK